MAQVFGITALLLVPIGSLWIASGHVNRVRDRQHAFAIAALGVSSFVWAAVSLSALVYVGFSLLICTFALWIYVLVKLIPRIRAMRGAPHSHPHAIAFYLLIVPIAVFLIQLALMGRLTEFSRGRAISNSSALIADIERYHAAYGRYPASLMALWPDYLPGLIGIERFQYEPSGDAYNVFFEQFSFSLGTREIVMYNPRDQQAFSSHTMDLLQFTPEDLEPRRGYYAVRDASHPHWKRFLFD
jgi:hypothetical protein